MKELIVVIIDVLSIGMLNSKYSFRVVLINFVRLVVIMISLFWIYNLMEMGFGNFLWVILGRFLFVVILSLVDSDWIKSVMILENKIIYSNIYLYLEFVDIFVVKLLGLI